MYDPLHERVCLCMCVLAFVCVCACVCDVQDIAIKSTYSVKYDSEITF